MEWWVKPTGTDLVSQLKYEHFENVFFSVCKRIEFTQTFLISLLGAVTSVTECNYLSKGLLFQLYFYKYKHLFCFSAHITLLKNYGRFS
jgi:hypothetical protein